MLCLSLDGFFPGGPVSSHGHQLCIQGWIAFLNCVTEQWLFKSVTWPGSVLPLSPKLKWFQMNVSLFYSCMIKYVPCWFKYFPWSVSFLTFRLSTSIRKNLSSLTLLPFSSFPLFVEAVKQKPTEPEGEMLRRVISPMTDLTNFRLQIIMFDWALVRETFLLTQSIFRFVYTLVLSDKPHICVWQCRKECLFSWEIFYVFCDANWQVLWSHNH